MRDRFEREKAGITRVQKCGKIACLNHICLPFLLARFLFGMASILRLLLTDIDTSKELCNISNPRRWQLKGCLDGTM
jgi:hypothetical protein